MPDWSSQEELQRDSLAFNKLVHALLGIFAYEWLISLDFEWGLITGKKRFRWPLIFYFLNRYIMLFCLVGVVIALDVTTEVDCQALYLFNQFAGQASVGFASINLSIRTMAVWSQNIYIKVLLVVIILGHWSLILQGVLVKAAWVDGVGCVITSTNNTILAAVYIYSMCFDFTVLCLMAIRLLRNTNLAASKLAKMIFEDGLIYFFIAFFSNLAATVFMLLNLNQIMGIILNIPAAVASSIVACRVVRRLTNYQNSGAEVYGASTSHSGNVHIRGGSRGLAQQQFSARSGVHVQMETFKQEDASDRDIEAKPGLIYPRSLDDTKTHAL